MERDLAAVGQFDVVQNFNSHAHVERDVLHGFSFQIPHISTHTLTWSVTRGARRVVPPAKHFNSHAHVERDRGRPPAPPIRKISTHTLTWSVTKTTQIIAGGVSISTHTLTWSVTHLSQPLSVFCGFQLTRSRGA